MKKFLGIVIGLLVFQSAQAQVTSPAEFLGYDLGEEWTPHYKVMGYFETMAEQSPMVTFEQYGETYEGRELMYAVVTSEENQSNIEEIRLNNLRLAGLESGTPTENQKAIVWLSYNIHGNETSSSEAAMNTLYRLLTEKSQWLNDVVVIMDPMINPDGRDRYVNWYKSVVGSEPNANPESREHREPWPGGRTNHYYFDLNRDWAWQTQQESRQRVSLYYQWLPHVHVDYHEQGYNSPYYFAPAAEPFHKAITDWQREFQTMIGKNHTNYFNRENWLYFTREVFDLFYPSYGDTWPTFNGAIGMTYEQAGHSRAGLAVVTTEGDTLTLLDRLTHHTVTGLSTIEITAQNYERVITEFADYFERTRQNPAGEYKSYVIKKSSNPDKVTNLLQYLVKQRIEVGVAQSSGRYEGYDYSTGQTGRVSVEEGDYVINANQPKGTLVRVLFEPNPELADSVTYDITAWESHYAYGVEGYALKSIVNTGPIRMVTESDLTPVIDRPYAYLAEWNSIEDLKYLVKLLNKDVKVRYAENAFSIDGRNYKSGTLIITRNGNEKLGDKFDEIVKNAADELSRTVIPVSTGYVASGKDFGSSSVRYIEKPEVVLISGEGTRSNEVGHIWHYFDQQIGYPINLVNRDDMGSLELHNYDVLIMPSGSYGETFDEDGMEKLKDWIRDGGRLVAVGGANRFLAGKDGFNLETKIDEAEEETVENPEDKLKKYGNERRDRVVNSNPGSVYKLTMDTTHPLAFGYGESYFSLKLGSSTYEYLENGWNVGVAKKDAHRSGFVGHEAKEALEHTLSFGVQEMGRGRVVYMIDNPLYRGFWHNGKLLFGNAVFFAGN